MFRSVLRIVFVTCVAGPALSATTLLAASSELKNVIILPCGKAPFLACAEIPKTVLEKKNARGELVFDGLVGEMIDGIYEGKFYPNGKGVTVSNKKFETVGAPPLCSVLPLREKACGNETKKNWKGEACLPFSRVGYTSFNGGSFSLRSTAGSAETSKMASFLALAVANEAEAIREEVRSNRLSIDPNSGCAVQGRELYDLIEAQKKIPGIEAIPRCDPSNTQACSVRKYFDAAWESIVSGYLFVTRCRLAENSAKAYRAATVDMISKLEANAYQPCWKSCDAESTCLQRCYEDKAAKWMENHARSTFPRVASACAGS